MTTERRRTIRKWVDFGMAIIRTLAGVVSVIFNIYIFFKVLHR